MLGLVILGGIFYLAIIVATVLGPVVRVLEKLRTTKKKRRPRVLSF